MASLPVLRPQMPPAIAKCPPVWTFTCSASGLGLSWGRSLIGQGNTDHGAAQLCARLGVEALGTLTASKARPCLWGSGQGRTSLPLPLRCLDANTVPSYSQRPVFVSVVPVLGARSASPEAGICGVPLLTPNPSQGLCSFGLGSSAPVEGLPLLGPVIVGPHGQLSPESVRSGHLSPLREPGHPAVSRGLSQSYPGLKCRCGCAVGGPRVCLRWADGSLAPLGRPEKSP